MRHRITTLLVVLAVAFTALVVGPTGPAAADVPDWAPADEATIRPGTVVVVDGGGQCTSNFVVLDGGDVLLGMSAHCAGTGGNDETEGCTAGVLDNGVAVDVDGATHPGTMVYNSWVTMQAVGESDSDACRFNDFALVRLDPRDVPNVNPTFQGWGGPLAISPGAADGEAAYTFGQSSLRPGFSQKQGTVVSRQGGGWTYTVSTRQNPGIPGDSGSGFLDADGGAFGVVSTIAVFPETGTNGVTDLRMALDYAREHVGLQPRLALGTEPFTPTGEEASERTDPPTTDDPAAGDDAAVGDDKAGDDVPVTRLAGDDRYATAVATSRAGFDRAEVVFVTTGTAAPDALAAGPAAARLGAPLLLAGPDGLGTATLAEVRRLEATRAVVVGGPRAVPSSVEQQLRDQGVGEVDRIAGGDRYATAAAVAERFAEDGGPVFVATGTGFADALSAAPLAAATGASLVLTERDRLPSSTSAFLESADTSTLVVLGGPQVVSAATADAAGRAAGVAPTRVAGGDRYATAAAVADELLDIDDRTGGTLWLASGADFPDALAGGPAVAADRAVLLLVPPSGAVPASIDDVVTRLGPDGIVVLGGPGAVGTAVVDDVRTTAAS